MTLTKPFLSSLLLFGMLVGGQACTGTITDDVWEDGPGDGERTPEQEEEERAICNGQGGPTETCEVTADCTAPLVCHTSKKCVGPNDPAYTCDEAAGIGCQQEGESCVNGMCVTTPGACETLDDCPNRHICDTDKQCKPDGAAASCSDDTAGPELGGTYKVVSVLHMRDGLPDVLAKILGGAKKASDIINGDIDLGLPSIVESALGSLLSGMVRQYIPTYAVALVDSLASLDDAFNKMEVEGTLSLKGEACDGNYRGSHSWDFVKVKLDGKEVRVKPNDLPGVENFLPEDFSARYYCGDLLIDRHRIKGALDNLMRYALDEGTKALTTYTNIEDALGDIVNCAAVALEVNSFVANSCSICPNVSNTVENACDGLVQVAIAQVTQGLDEASAKMTEVRLRAVIPVSGDKLGDGQWYGSLGDGDFKGTLKATKTSSEPDTKRPPK